MYVQRNTEGRSRNQRGRGKAGSVTYYECVFMALVIQHAMRMRRTVLSSVACLGPLYFPHVIPINGAIFEQLFTQYNVCVLLSLRLLFEPLLILRRNERDVTINALHVRYLSCHSCQILIKLDFFSTTLETNHKL
jgi:hypothetical protein